MQIIFRTTMKHLLGARSLITAVNIQIFPLVSKLNEITKVIVQVIILVFGIQLFGRFW